MSDQRRGGTITLQNNGQTYDAKGNFSYNLGRPKREAIIGEDGVHGYKEVPQVPYIEGEITDRKDLDLATLLTMTGATCTLQLANGKVIMLSDAWYAGDGKASTQEGNIAFRMEGKNCDEVS